MKNRHTHANDINYTALTWPAAMPPQDKQHWARYAPWDAKCEEITGGGSSCYMMYLYAQTSSAGCFCITV